MEQTIEKKIEEYEQHMHGLMFGLESPEDDGFVHIQRENDTSADGINSAYYLCGRPTGSDPNHGLWFPESGLDACPHCGEPICPKCYDLALAFSQLDGF